MSTAPSRFLTHWDTEELRATPADPPAYVRVTDLADRTPRTLVYGYRAGRDTFHLYLDADGQFARFVYGWDHGIAVDGSFTRRLAVVAFHRDDKMAADWVYPTKRVYPERCDYEFCRVVRDKFGIVAPFTTWDPDRVPAPGVMYHGELYGGQS